MPENKQTRTERDSMGAMEVPQDAYFGASTQRAVQNFPIGDLRLPSDFIHVLGLLKQAAAKVNVNLGLLNAELGQAIEKAAHEVYLGLFDKHFVIDLFQTGSGTSTNTNANEIIARRAAEFLGNSDTLPHPNDHVNLGQSSNDVIPTVAHLTAAQTILGELIPALREAIKTLDSKAQEFWPVVKTGRTHLQDATPIRLGQEFQGYADQLRLATKRLEGQGEALCEVALGGTAVGTGVNTHEQFAEQVCEILSGTMDFNIRETSFHFQAQGTLDTMLAASSTVRGAGIALQKIANDLRWLASGPRAGIGELEMPAVQPGSSIMPGKVNPVIAESLLQVIAHVVGNDATICMAAQGGYLELNTYWPVAAYHLHQSSTLLASAVVNFDRQCLRDIKATAHGPAMIEQGLMLATGLTPVLGYDAAAEIAKEGAATGKTIREIAIGRGDLTKAQLDLLLDPTRMLNPRRETEPDVDSSVGKGD